MVVFIGVFRSVLHLLHKYTKENQRKYCKPKPLQNQSQKGSLLIYFEQNNLKSPVKETIVSLSIEGTLNIT